MAGTAKISISVNDPALLAWARQRSKRTGLSLSAVFTGAIRLERQMEARAAFLEAEGPDGRATPAEMEAIRAEWGETPARSARPAPRRRAPARARPAKRTR